MKSKIIWVLLGIFILIWAVNLVVTKVNPKADTASIKIGAALSLSGQASQDGESIKNGLEIARADLKAKGVNVDISYQDDQTDPKNTVTVMNVLGAMNVQAIIGPTWSYLADSGIPVADRLKIVAVMPANTSEYVNARSPYEFFTTAKVDNMAPTLADWLKASGKKKIAIIRNQGSWYEVVERAVLAAAKLADVEVVYKENFAFGTAASSLATVMTKVKAANPDLIFFEVDDDVGVTTFLNKSQQLQIKSDIMSVTTALGRVITSNNIKLNAGNSLYLVAPTTSDAFNAKYKAFYGKDAAPYADRSYDSLMLLVDAIQKHGTTPLNEYMRSSTNYDGYLGNYKFDASGDIQSGEWMIKKVI